MKKLLFYLTLFVPGIFHLYLRDLKKAFVFLSLALLEYFLVFFVIRPFDITSLLIFKHQDGAYQGLTTIGSTPQPKGSIDFLWNYDSFSILVYSVFAILFLLMLLGINYSIARNARGVAQGKTEGIEPLSLRDSAYNVRKDLAPLVIGGPAFLLMLLFLFVPAIISILIAFTNYSLDILPPAKLVSWVGMENFGIIFKDPSINKQFYQSIWWTLIWTFCSAGLVIGLGTFLAVVAHDKRLKGIKIFRTIYLLPWAIPSFLTILVFKMFFSKAGIVNTAIIPFLTGEAFSPHEAIGFLLDPNLAKITIILIQGWLGFPFVFMLVTGTLQAIPDDLYEASKIDGGNLWSDFWDITFPLIMLTIAPLLVTQFTFAFNNVAILYMLAENVPPDIGNVYSPVETMASVAYRLTLDAEYSKAATITLLSSLVVSTVVIISWVKLGAFKNEEVM